MSTSANVVVFLCVAATLLSGCLDGRCDPGQTLAGGQCAPPQTADAMHDDVSADSGTDLAADGRASSADAEVDALADNLGDPCTESEDCGGIAPFCVVMPGQTSGYCTIQDCTITPQSCPPGYTCMDISKYVPGKPNLCIKQ